MEFSLRVCILLFSIFKPVQRVRFCQTIKSSKISFIISCHNNTKTFLYNNTYIPRYIHVHVIRYQYSNLFFESSDHLNNFFETHYLDLPQVKCGRATTTVFHWNFIHVMQNTPFIKYKNKPHFASRLYSKGLPLSGICVVVTIWSIWGGAGTICSLHHQRAKANMEECECGKCNSAGVCPNSSRYDKHVKNLDRVLWCYFLIHICQVN